MLLSRSRTAPEAWPTAFSSPDRVAAGDGDAAPKGPPRDDELVEALMARLSEKEADAALAAEVGQELLKEVTVLKRRLADLESAASGGLAPEGAGAGGAFPRLAACFLVTGAEGVPATPDENAPPPAVRDLPLTLERQHSDLRPALANMRPVSAVAAGSRHRTPASPVRRIQMRQLVAASPSYNVKNNASLCTVWGNSGTPSLLSPLMAEEEEENQTSISEMKPNSPKGGADADVPDQSVRFPLRDLTDPFQDRDGEGGVKHNAAAESQMFQSVVKSLSLRIAILEREKGEIQERVMDAEREGNAAKRALARKEENEAKSQERIWTLELQLQEYRDQLEHLEQAHAKATSENHRQSQLLSARAEQIEALKLVEERLNGTIARNRTRFNQERAELKKKAAVLAHDKAEIARWNEELCAEVRGNLKKRGWKGDVKSWIRQNRSPGHKRPVAATSVADNSGEAAIRRNRHRDHQFPHNHPYPAYATIRRSSDQAERLSSPQTPSKSAPIRRSSDQAERLSSPQTPSKSAPIRRSSDQAERRSSPQTPSKSAPIRRSSDQADRLSSRQTPSKSASVWSGSGANLVSAAGNEHVPNPDNPGFQFPKTRSAGMIGTSGEADDDDDDTWQTIANYDEREHVDHGPDEGKEPATENSTAHILQQSRPFATPRFASSICSRHHGQATRHTSTSSGGSLEYAAGAHWRRRCRKQVTPGTDPPRGFSEELEKVCADFETPTAADLRRRSSFGQRRAVSAAGSPASVRSEAGGGSGKAPYKRLSRASATSRPSPRPMPMDRDEPQRAIWQVNAGLKTLDPPVPGASGGNLEAVRQHDEGKTACVGTQTSPLPASPMFDGTVRPAAQTGTSDAVAPRGLAVSQTAAAECASARPTPAGAKTAAADTRCLAESGPEERDGGHDRGAAEETTLPEAAAAAPPAQDAKSGVSGSAGAKAADGPRRSGRRGVVVAEPVDAADAEGGDRRTLDPGSAGAAPERQDETAAPGSDIPDPADRSEPWPAGPVRPSPPQAADPSTLRKFRRYVVERHIAGPVALVTAATAKAAAERLEGVVVETPRTEKTLETKVDLPAGAENAVNAREAAAARGPGLWVPRAAVAAVVLLVVLLLAALVATLVAKSV